MADDLLVTDEVLEDPLVMRRLLSDIIERLDDDVNSVVTEALTTKIIQVISGNGVDGGAALTVELLNEIIGSSSFNVAGLASIETLVNLPNVTGISGGDSTTTYPDYPIAPYLVGVLDYLIHYPTITVDPAPPTGDLVGFSNIGYILSGISYPYFPGPEIGLRPANLSDSVPSEWTGYTGYANIEEACKNAIADHVYFYFPDMPVIPKYGDPTIFSATTSAIHTNNLDAGHFDPLNEYPGDTLSWTTRVVGFYVYPTGNPSWTGLDEFLNFGGEAGNYAFNQNDIPEWLNVSFAPNADVWIKLSNA